MVVNRHPLGLARLIIVISEERLLKLARHPAGNLFESRDNRVTSSPHKAVFPKRREAVSEGKSLIRAVIGEVGRAANHLKPDERVSVSGHVEGVQEFGETAKVSLLLLAFSPSLMLII